MVQGWKSNRWLRVLAIVFQAWHCASDIICVLKKDTERVCIWLINLNMLSYRQFASLIWNNHDAGRLPNIT